MIPIRTMLGRLVADFAKRQVQPVGNAAMLWGAAFLLFLLVIGFVIAGIYAAFEAWLGPIAAAFIMAGIALIGALILVFAAKQQIERLKEPSKPPPLREGGEAESVGNIAASFAYGFFNGIGRKRRTRNQDKSGE